MQEHPLFFHRKTGSDGKKEFDASKFIYHSEVFDLKEAAKRENAGKPRSKFIVKKDIPIAPDTLCWIRDFAYSYNEPMTKRYFSHPAFGNYPVVGVSWKQANAFCEWRTHYLNAYLDSKKEHRNQISACPPKHNGNMQPVAVVLNPCSPGVIIISVIKRAV